MVELPNVLLVIVDQLRGDSLGCVGHPNAVTPNIDRLSARGVTFTRHYAQSSPCGPSRARHGCSCVAMPIVLATW